MTTSTTQPFKLMIFGGRDFKNYALLSQVLKDIRPKFPEDRELQIISGMARGADSLAVRYAQAHNIPLLKYPADWSLGRGAGFIRNTQMAEACDEGLAFHDGASRGTAHSVNELVRLGKKVRVVSY